MKGGIDFMNKCVLGTFAISFSLYSVGFIIGYILSNGIPIGETEWILLGQRTLLFSGILTLCRYIEYILGRKGIIKD